MTSVMYTEAHQIYTGYRAISAAVKAHTGIPIIQHALECQRDE